MTVLGSGAVFVPEITVTFPVPHARYHHAQWNTTGLCDFGIFPGGIQTASPITEKAFCFVCQDLL